MRVPEQGVAGEVLTVNRVIFESDGTVYLVVDAKDDTVFQRLQDEYGWRTVAGG